MKTSKYFSYMLLLRPVFLTLDFAVLCFWGSGEANQDFILYSLDFSSIFIDANPSLSGLVGIVILSIHFQLFLASYGLEI